MNELDVLIDVAKKLNSINVQYMLTGSFAMNYYAEPRMTRDIDIVVNINSSDIRKIIKTFSTDYYLSENAIKEAIDNARMFNAIHNESVVKVDFVVRKNTEYRINEFNRRKRIQINNVDIQIVRAEDLIISKLIWMKDTGSELQKRDLYNLLNQKTDREYLNTWIEKLKLQDFLKELDNERH